MPKGGLIDTWILRRVARQSGTVEIGRKRVYILPTRFGWGFALMSFIMLLGATNYANSMAFALCFLLAALGLVSLHHTHANLVSLRVRAGNSTPGFAGETLGLQIIIDNPSARVRYDLQAAWRGEPTAHQGDLSAAGSLHLDLPLQAGQRGYQAAPGFRLSTEFPLGLFRAWTWIELDMGAWVYPSPIDSGALPIGQGYTETHSEHASQSGDDFMGLRPYRIGDPLGRVHWKRMAVERIPQVKQFGQARTTRQWLDWNALPQLQAEARLSQIAFWALRAQESGIAFGLRLPGREVAIAEGEAHLHRCLLELAMFGGAAR